MSTHPPQLSEQQAAWTTDSTPSPRKAKISKADVAHILLTGVAIAISCIALIVNVYERREATKASATLTYARGFFAGLSSNVVSKYYKYRSSLEDVDQASRILTPDESLMIYLYLDQALKCVEQSQCDQFLFCEYLGADMSTLLLHYENDIHHMLNLNYPKGKYFEHTKASLAETCNEYWNTRHW